LSREVFGDISRFKSPYCQGQNFAPGIWVELTSTTVLVSTVLSSSAKSPLE